MKKIIPITSLSNETLKSWMRLHHKKHRDQTNTFLIEGRHGVEEAIKANHCVSVWTTDASIIDFDGPIYVSEQHILNKLSSVMSNIDMIGLCNIPILPIKKYHRLFLCDGIQDPGNLGTIIRSALAFGFDGIYLSQNSVDFTNEKVVRATQGAIFQLPIHVVDLEETLTHLNEKGVLTVGLSVDQTLIKDCEAHDQMAFVLGNEGQGITPTILKQCQLQLTIPIINIESLNVGITAGIIAYQFSSLNQIHNHK